MKWVKQQMIKSGRKELLNLVIAILFMVPWISAHALDKSTSKYSEDEKTLRTQAEDYARAFASGNATAVANMWVSDGSFTDTEGREYKGRNAIQALLESHFRQFGGQPLEVSVESIRFPASSVAIEEGTSRLLSRSSLPISSSGLSRYTAVHVKENGKWQMAAVVETNSTPDSNKVFLKDLGWLVGNWAPGGSSPNNIHFKAHWTANRNFIHCIYEAGGTGESQIKETEIIGYNPLTKRITSWHFDSNGGFGNGKWLRDGQSWIVSATSVEPDGTVGSAIYTLRKLNDNSFTWRSTRRSLAGRPLPNTQEIIVTRQETKTRMVENRGERIVDHD